MATRQEEIQNLQTMQYALQRQDELAKRIENEEKYVNGQYERHINDYPEYKPKTFCYYRNPPRKTQRERKKITILDVEFELPPKYGISIAYWILWCYAVGYSMMYAMDYAVTDTSGVIMIIAGAMIGLGILCSIVCRTIEYLTHKKLDTLVRTVTLLSIRSFILIVASVIFFFIEFAEGFNIVAVFTLICAGLTVCSTAGYVAVMIVYKKEEREAIRANKEEARKEREARCEYEKEEAARRAKYNKEKSVADARIAKEREALRAEVAENVAQSRARIEAYKAEYQQLQQLLVQTPGLALEDKNSYTVSALVSYFSRGRADSIKEGLNLLIRETREEAVLEEKRRARRAQEEALWRMETKLRIAQENWEREQRKAQEEILDNQRRHNERVEEEVHKARESLEEEIGRWNGD